MTKNNSDIVNNPSHYKGKNGIEFIDVIEAFDLGFKEANIIKYVLRAKFKGKELQDLEKARWYLERKINKFHDCLDKKAD